jgi:hypothetical protein
MIPVRRLVILVALLLGGLYAGIQPRCAWACSCLPLGSASEERDRATAVFAGRVTSIESPSDPSSSPPALHVTFAVGDVWKGALAGTTVVHTAPDSAACGVAFAPGQTYLVYASTDDTGALAVSLCSRTQPLAQASADVAALGGAHGAGDPTPPPAVLPDTAGDSTVAQRTAPLLALVASGGLGVLAVAVACAWWRTRRG